MRRIAQSADDVAAGADSPLKGYCIALQPICDGELNHVADELLYRESDTATSAVISPEQAATATARVCHIAFYEAGLEKLAGKRKLFLNAPREWLLNPELLLPNPKQLVVEVLETVTVDTQVLAALKKIRRMGFEVALDDFILMPETAPLLDVAHIVKVDLQQPFDEAAVALYKSRGLKLLAEKVEDDDTFERLRGMGFTLFQGYFYARPQTQRDYTDRRSNNRAALLRLVAELQRRNADFREIENIVMQDAQLTFQLLRYVNSAFFHYKGRIETVFQALQVLGLKQLRNMALIMLMANNGPASKLLLAQALTRAGMCERLAAGVGSSEDSAFLAGLLSMMGELLGQSLPKLLTELALSTELTKAILTKKGRLGGLLHDVEAFEAGSIHGWAPDRVELYNRAWLQSQAWTTETLSMVDGV